MKDMIKLYRRLDAEQRETIGLGVISLQVIGAMIWLFTFISW